MCNCRLNCSINRSFYHNKGNSQLPTKNTWYYPANSPSYVTYKMYGSYSGRNRHYPCRSASIRNF